MDHILCTILSYVMKHHRLMSHKMMHHEPKKDSFSLTRIFSYLPGSEILICTVFCVQFGIISLFSQVHVSSEDNVHRKHLR